jgi:hypothetical protein
MPIVRSEKETSEALESVTVVFVIHCLIRKNSRETPVRLDWTFVGVYDKTRSYSDIHRPYCNWPLAFNQLLDMSEIQAASLNEVHSTTSYADSRITCSSICSLPKKFLRNCSCTSQIGTVLVLSGTNRKTPLIKTVLAFELLK